METYICPNDRQLALRARLGAGWSSRAQSAQSRPATRLSTEEEEQILQVLRRNEDLVQREKHRIDQMLQRLDRMKHDSTVHTRTECSICKQEFGRLSNLAQVCSDCGRHVCSACSVDVPVARRSRNSHPFTTRTWIAFRPGAASALSTPVHNASNSALTRSRHFSDNIKTPNGRSPTDETAKEKASQRVRSVSTSISQKGHDFLERIRERRGSRQTPTTETICKICREAREIWKRSGAWFYKTLPRPSSPATSPTSPDMMLPQTVSSPTELVQPVTAAQTEQEPTSWIKLQPRRQFSKRIQRDLMDQPTSSASQRSDKPEVTSPLSKAPIMESLITSPNGTTLNPLVTSAGLPTRSNSSSFGQTEQQRKVIGGEHPPVSTIANMNMKSASDISISRPGSNQTPLASLPYQTSYFNQKPPVTSSASLLASSFGAANSSSKKVASLTGEAELPALAGTSQPTVTVRDTRASSDDAPFGILYFTLYHDTINKQLHVAIHKAKNLIAMDANGLSDPYVVCEILPSSQHSPRPRTSTRPQCLNPVWNEALTFEPVEEKTLHHKTLRFAVLDEDLYGSDWLGEYWLALNRLTPDRLTDFTVPLGPKKPLHRGERDLACPTRGKIQLGLRFLEERRQLCVEVIRCSDLASMDPNGLSDPFVKLYLRPDKAKKTKQKTQIKKATLFPEFHEQFFYDMHPSDAAHKTLEITVWDFDRGPSNDFIGGLTLGADAKAERRELWLAVFRPPYRRIEAWFQLSSRTQSENHSSTPGICD
ncbi:hypothetical protein CRM22_005463 [Opisthorchis felineus]|uniref:Rabphilin-3A n=1 Tax=Opisthorchis felineus TaxID=147828 RepID=A0A4S2LR11_OPIFE|nr:hypothetical protein CRM22_005463 [Opisthorchis felineus]